eukprot:11537077-Karenia_brevis.AAC.1
MKGPQFIVNNKKALQAHVDGAELGQSPTQQYAYNVFLWRTPLIITTNNFNLTSLAAVDREWVEANCYAVCIAEPVWDSRQNIPAAPTVVSKLKRPAAARTPLSTPQR